MHTFIKRRKPIGEIGDRRAQQIRKQRISLFLSNTSSSNSSTNSYNSFNASTSEGVNSVDASSSEGVNSFDASSSEGVNSFNASSSEGVNSFNASSSEGVNSFTSNIDINKYLFEQELSDSEFSDPNDVITAYQFKNTLKNIIFMNNISTKASNQILNLLHLFGLNFLPKDKRTLMHTPKDNNIKVMGDGFFVYFGLLNQICNHFIFNSVDIQSVSETILTQMNIDGVVMSENSNTHFWPILINFPEITNDPFVVACFFGHHKPPSISMFFEEFVSDFNALRIEGFKFLNKTFFLQFQALICDSPARAFVCCSRAHNFTYGCHKCLSKSIWKQGIMHFKQTRNLPIRSSFENEFDFFVRQSPLKEIGFDFVKNIPIETMHTVYLGALKRFLNLLITKKLLKKSDLEIIDTRIDTLKKITPVEFARKCRSLNFVSKWKATEFRQFLLYTGPFLLNNLPSFSKSIYITFLSLHISLRILSSSVLCTNTDLLTFVKRLLIIFVENFQIIFGVENCCYTIHSLLHLVEDSQFFRKPLEYYSAFKFENKLGILRRKIKNSKLPLVQLHNRVKELETLNLSTLTANDSHLSQHSFKLVKGDRIICNNSDCYLLLKNLKFCKVVSFHRNSNTTFKVKIFNSKEAYYNQSINSMSVFNFCTVKHLSTNSTLIVENDILAKCFCLNTDGDQFLMLPLLH